MSQPMAIFSTDLTDAERRMVMAAVRGEVADLAGEAVRGSILRDLILEARPGWLLPRHGLSLGRLVVLGGLDLDGAVVDKPVTLTQARVEPLASARATAGEGTVAVPTAVALGSARLRRLTLHASVLAGSLLADRVEVDSNLLIGGGEIEGVVQMRAAIVRGMLAVEGARIGDGHSSLLAAGLRVAGPLVLRRSTLLGAVSLPRSRLDGGLKAEDARISATGRADLDLEGARVGGDVMLERVAAGGGIVLGGSRVDGRVALDEARVGGLGVLAAKLATSGPLTLAGARLSGPVRLDGAAIGGDIDGRGVEVHGGEIAVSARAIEIAGTLDLGSAKLVGLLDVCDARIAGGVALAHARLFGTATALDGAGCRVGATCRLDHTVAFGRISLQSAAIGAAVSFAGAAVKVERGAAVDLTGLTAGGDVELGRGFTAIGGVSLSDARVERGSLSIAGSEIVAAARANPATSDAAGEDVAVDLSRARVASLEMAHDAATRPRGIIDLTDAAAGDFIDHMAGWPLPASAADADHLVLSGFCCHRIVHPAGVAGQLDRVARPRERAGQRRIAWLETQPRAHLDHRFVPQPWREIVRHLDAEGLREDARLVTLAGLRRQRLAEPDRRRRWASWLDDVTMQYGYRPWRPLVALALMLVAFAAAYAAAARCPASVCVEGPAFVDVAPPRLTDHSDVSPAEFDALAYAIDVGVPLLDLGHARRWQPNRGWRPLGAPAVLARGTDIAGIALTGGALLALARDVQRGLGLLLVAVALVAFVRTPRRIE